MSPANFAKDYIEVADRIREWYERWPGGAIRTEIVDRTDALVTVRAEVYRGTYIAPDGPNYETPAGVGHSSLAIPGETPFTRGAELENAETSAVGRALVMAGIPSKNVASANEVRAKKSGGAAAPPSSTATERGGQLKSTNKQAISGRTTTPSPGSDVEGGGQAHGLGAAASTVGAVSPPANPSANVEAPGGASTTSEPAGEGIGEGPEPAGSGHTIDIVALWEMAADHFGSVGKTVLWMKRKHPDWDIRTEADVIGWHLVTALAEEQVSA